MKNDNQNKSGASSWLSRLQRRHQVSDVWNVPGSNPVFYWIICNSTVNVVLYQFALLIHPLVFNTGNWVIEKGRIKKEGSHLFLNYNSNTCYPTWFLQTIHPKLSSHSDDQVSYNRLLHRLIYFPQILFFFYQIDCSASIQLFASPQRFVLLTTSHSQY